MTESVDMLINSDQDLFLWLNGHHTPWLDSLMYWITFKYTWIPMYMVLIAVHLRKDWKKGLAELAVVLVAVIIADKITSGLMKPYFVRFRPCHEPELQGLVHQVTGCGGLYGFASSHASTSFAVATAWFAFLRTKAPNMWLIFVWAAIYSYSRVYVGVHYPADIVIGALIGLLVGWLCIKLYHTFLTRYYRI
ncbi:phosphatase PAP2 family protein [Dyadobacter chenwenxiniae]|uniref:Phosphatase PAP2 family protein n=1 Tax=Dyadobacter chenwenxiniae TaxID=2906456 RepID=A0A9X1PLR6_9BACT|nr:phosphatase PAP2 family protein [Dyadobacter chenwenxiniae]MCF0062735.1 phosphatase PAP2 family protein [Dyadobacter chenwenxiniae]UON85088.1 phosphatase PAP2 family protein [Dyadobacter chenwenxiniae]